MKKLFIVFLTLMMAVSAAAWFEHSHVEEVELGEIKNKNYRIHIVSEYPSRGMLEPLAHNKGKRDMVLKQDSVSEMKDVCKVLYSKSITKHSSPCGELG